MTVTAEQIEIAKSHGMQNVELIAQCCGETGGRFFVFRIVSRSSRFRCPHLLQGCWLVVSVLVVTIAGVNDRNRRLPIPDCRPSAESYRGPRRWYGPGGLVTWCA